MKAFVTGFLALFVSISAYAYYSAQGNDPTLGNYDTEYKVAVKSETDTYSDAISKGHGLYYSENELTGLYKVSRYYSGAGNTQASAAVQACVAARNVATGDVAGFPCVTKGYVDYARYDATSPIAKGEYLCVGTAATVRGVFVDCASGVISPFVALEAKTSGTGSDLKISVQSK